MLGGRVQSTEKKTVLLYRIMLALAWIISSVRNLNAIVQLLLLQLMGTDGSGSSSLSGAGCGMVHVYQSLYLLVALPVTSV